ncbi:hypothetical protein EDD80_1016 [Anseongella ginsenosidimutans]|uniref:Natural product n=1 Tax=Anseongella ginsenosidimutans TaxID=496056 RepID=A0A4R3KVR7_9SPHI|nr:hypothetical protein [Anseongella ginsenosidimutans]QEC51478.1 hypothetical protein FRZ59_03335 [Anseongella ginsenosidimutans]TCS89809.1 hypothetical protein EDD80_1016 [Anseongella ginsenosidimutans]
MNKLKLNLKDVEEILTREQLKQVVGGNGSDTSCECRLTASDGNDYPIELNPEPTTESDCSTRCESAYDDINSSGGTATDWTATWGSGS